MDNKIDFDIRLGGDIYDRLMPPNFPACTREMLRVVIDTAIDITHENGTYDGTRDAVIQTITHTITDLKHMIDIYNENHQ